MKMKDDLHQRRSFNFSNLKTDTMLVLKFSSGGVRRPFSKLPTKLYEIRRKLGHEWLVDILVSSRVYVHIYVPISIH